MMAFWVAALVVLLSGPTTSNAHWTPPQATPHPQIFMPTTFVPIHASPKYVVRRYARQNIAKTSLFALDVKGNEKGELSLKAITSPKKRVKKSTKSSRSKKGKGSIKQNAKKAIPKNQKQSKKKTNLKTTSPTKSNDKEVLLSEEVPSGGIIYIQFSRVFQRHVVYQRHSGIDHDDANPHGTTDKVIQSFEFLDDAIQLFPETRVLAPQDLPFPPPSCSLVYPDENNDGGDRLLVRRGRLIDSDIEEEECETTIAGMGLWTLCELEYDAALNNTNSDKDYHYQQAHEALRTLLQLVSSQSSFTAPRHFFRLDPRRIAMRGHTSESIALNHERIVNLLSCGMDGNDEISKSKTVGLAMDSSDVAFVLQNFPQLCLYNCGELESLVRFLLQPLPLAGSIPSVAIVADRGDDGRANVDWPSLSGNGYGAGLTVDQATSAIRMMPELLALYYEDSRKPSMVYMYNQMMLAPVPPKLIDEATIQLNLEGADPSDAYTFAYLFSLGVSWSQLRILISSLPLWTTSNLEPGWELLQKGPVRSMLKRPSLDYLRQRLQIGPSDIYRLLKTHTRMSTYDASNKMLPTLDMLQSKLVLSSAELRKIMLRMPSIMGMGKSGFDDRLDFFTNEAGMSVDDVKEAVMKQPSLLQYGVSSTLRPKLHFFLEELGISETSVGRIVKSAPAVMGLSLTDNLRPKVVSMMKICSLDPHELGHIISTSPQTLLLSQKSKIEPTLKFLSSVLMLSEPVLGQMVLKTPRVLRQGLETSLAKKIEMLTNNSDSKEAAIAIVCENPALLVASNAVLEDRIERCPEDVDIATWLLPSKKGRRKSFQQSKTELSGDPIIVASDASFGSLTKIFPSITCAAHELDISESAIREACRNVVSIDGNYLYSLTDSPLALPKDPQKAKMPHHTKTIPISIFCSGGIYPSDNADVARGQSRTGGLAIQVFTDGSILDKSQFLQEFSAAANSCLGIHVPRNNDQDESILIAVFPLMSPSRNRCELFSCSASLRICEAFLKTKSNEKETLYDIKVYTESNYAWKLAKSKDHLLELGCYLTSQEMLSHLDVASYLVNIDILHPLVRSFSRLNGHTEPLGSAHQTFGNANVEFLHSMDEITLINGGLSYVRRLTGQAKYAAMW
eukprot:CAMPEP_0172332500 /NCGR_PEP_ID=MMETSP1058-20130122/62469_1 /TAXON_ID=83371 /ORGANISM="Detonula confervacea, Strain CCMP 353" /LENGTH=1128 /DNA_ID=CAMNT_0013049791 /DNA_START=143 /DNA_END=3526 /DNA_ORIENTATION=+